MGCGCNKAKPAPPPPPTVVEEPIIIAEVVEEKEPTQIDAALEIRATASLEESVKEDLEKEDPAEEVAKAVLNNTHNGGNGGIGGF